MALSESDETSLDRLVLEYVDRWNAGERIDRARIESEQPEFAEAILAELETFIDLGGGDEAIPLGEIGDYRLLRRVGRGGMGVVYEAWEGSLDRRVALKVLPPGIAADSRTLTRFVREAKVAAKLQHPHIVSVHGMGVREETPYFAMDFVEGETLAEILARARAHLREDAAGSTTKTLRSVLDTATVDAAYCQRLADAFAGAAEGLHHAHRQGVVHRDMKPSNLMLDRDGRLRILDFGLARSEGDESLTQSGDFVGTPLYMSPEQARAKKVTIDHRTDIYSLGATLYEMLTRRPPFRGKDPHDTLSQILTREPTPPSQIEPGVPPNLETITLKCLAKHPDDRFFSAEGLAQELRRFARGENIESRPPPRWERTARKLWRARGRLAVVGLVVVLAAAALFIGLKQRRDYLHGVETRARAAVMRLRVFLPNFQQATLGFSDLWEPVRAGPSEALSDLLTASQQFPSDAGLRYQLARALVFFHRPDEAVRNLEEALRIDAGFAPAACFLARIHDWRGETVDAERERRRVNAVPAGSWAHAWFQADRAVVEERYAEAVELYGTLLALDRSRGELFLGATVELTVDRGLLRVEAGDPQRAIEDFTRAEVFWPASTEPMLLRGRAYHVLGRKDLAREEFELLYANAVDRELVAEAIASAYDLLNDFEPSLEWAERMPPGLYRESRRAGTLHSLNRRDEALAAMGSALASSPNSAFLQEQMGWLLHDYRKSERSFDEDSSDGDGYRVPLPPGSYRMRLHLVEVWYRGAGSRRFDVRIEGETVIDDHATDPSALDRAEVREFTTRVEDGILDIELIAKTREAALCALEVERAE